MKCNLLPLSLVVNRLLPPATIEQNRRGRGSLDAEHTCGWLQMETRLRHWCTKGNPVLV